MRALETAVAVAVVAILAASPPQAAAQKKDCNDLKGEIEAKIKQNGIQSFSLAIVDAVAPPDGKVVGTCEGGRKLVVYKRGG